MSQNLRLPICPKCHETKFVQTLKTIHLSVYSERYKCTSCEIQWGGSTISECYKPNIQFSICKEFGLLFGKMYEITFRDSSYPCRCPCHYPIDGVTRRHIVACCHDGSFGPVICRLDGVFYDPDIREYILFTPVGNAFMKKELHVPLINNNDWSISLCTS